MEDGAAFCLTDAQKTHDIHVHERHLVQENGAAMGRFKPSQPSLQRPGERAFLVPEQFGSDQRRRNRGAVPRINARVARFDRL